MGSEETEDRAQEVGGAGKDEIQKWNWGAFLFGGIWGLGHKLWWLGIVGIVASFIPVVGIGVAIWFGLKGNRWIWERGGYSSKEELRQKERKWVKAWFIVVGIVIVLAVLLGALGG